MKQIEEQIGTSNKGGIELNNSTEHNGEQSQGTFGDNDGMKNNNDQIETRFNDGNMIIYGQEKTEYDNTDLDGKGGNTNVSNIEGSYHESDDEVLYDDEEKEMEYITPGGDTPQ